MSAARRAGGAAAPLEARADAGGAVGQAGAARAGPRGLRPRHRVRAHRARVRAPPDTQVSW